MKFFGSSVILMVLWLLMSGMFKPMLIGFGLISVVLVMVIVRRMDRVDGDRLDVHLSPLKSLTYIGWLLVEIAKSNWAVTKIILSPKMVMRQHMLDVPYSQKSDLAQVIFSNSITLTPGTISVETEQDTFLVHALAYAPNDDMKLSDMDRRVTAIENGKA
ncbi:MAG: Na+/H+ antiporter subunit E [Paracoccaceae bacterium]|nr:Na+/H+ antiporter subunit E [Paracoccaceae bacterium]